MKNAKLFLIAFVVVLPSFSMSVPANDAASDYQKRVFSGLGIVNYVGIYLGQACEPQGITESAVRTYTELQLRRNGIPLATEQHKGLMLNVHVGLLPLESPASSVFVVYIEMEEIVTTIERTKPADLVASTYSFGPTYGICPNDEISEKIKTCVLEQVDEFSNLYLKYNPSKPKSK